MPKSGGHFVPLVDFDGISRRVPMLVEYDGAYYESLSLAMVRSCSACRRRSEPHADDGSGGQRYAGARMAGSEETPRGTVRIPVDESAASLIPYRGQKAASPLPSIADALNKRLPVEALKARSSSSAPRLRGLMDLRATPVATYPPDPCQPDRRHARRADGLKPAYVLGAGSPDDRPLRPAAAMLPLPLQPARRRSWRRCLSASRRSIFAVAVGLMLPLASTLLLITALYAPGMSWGYFVESRSKRQFTGTVRPVCAAGAGRRWRATLSATAWKAATGTEPCCSPTCAASMTISEGLDPKELTQLDERVSRRDDDAGAPTTAARSTSSHRRRDHGLLGAPVADADHARNALRRRSTCSAGCAGWTSRSGRGWPVLHIGVGVNTGTMDRRRHRLASAQSLSRSWATPWTSARGWKASPSSTGSASSSAKRPAPWSGTSSSANSTGCASGAGRAGGDPRAPVSPARSTRRAWALKLWQQALRFYRAQGGTRPTCRSTTCCAGAGLPPVRSTRRASRTVGSIRPARLGRRDDLRYQMVHGLFHRNRSEASNSAAAASVATLHPRTILVNHDVLIDAGTGVAGLSLAGANDRSRVSDAFAPRSHLQRCP